MRILFVALADSIHTARWINQLTDQDWDIHLFPSQDSPVHSDFRKITIHDLLIKQAHLDDSVCQTGAIPFLSGLDTTLVQGYWGRIRRIPQIESRIGARSTRLAQVIRKTKPDIIHSLEIQNAGYLTLDAKQQLHGKFPTWIVTNWGSDIYLFGRLPAHRERIKAVLDACDYYTCECQRDVELARELGFDKHIPSILPNTGGIDLTWARQFAQPGLPSARRLIVLKGYQHWAGRALVGLRALELCADMLKGYRVAIYSASADVQLAAELFAQSTGIPIDLVPQCSHEDILRLHGQARLSIGLSIGDAISTSFLEALAMGSFPIQSFTSCASEWIRDGESGLLVPPEDPDIIAAAIRRALSDDDMIDRAVQRNAQVAAERLNYTRVKRQAIERYTQIANGII